MSGKILEHPYVAAQAGAGVKVWQYSGRVVQKADEPRSWFKPNVSAISKVKLNAA